MNHVIIHRPFIDHAYAKIKNKNVKNNIMVE